MNKLKEKILEQDPDFFNNLDPNLRLLAREIKKMLRQEEDCVIGITGYPGKGKSNFAALLGILIDDSYSFDKSICFIPSSKEIEDMYLQLPKYSFFHIDEASRGLHKQKWHDKIQQKLNLLYDTEREGHYLCTGLLMPRFQNFSENFRNFRIVYWINVVTKGLCIAYRKDEDKDTKDPWHIDENYKVKTKYWKGKKVFDRSLGDIIRVEQRTPNYWFYFQVPPIPEEVWKEYQELKSQSRIEEKKKEDEINVENHKDKLEREKLDRWKRISELNKEGKTAVQQAVIIGCSEQTIRRAWKEMRTYKEIKGDNTIVTNRVSNKNTKSDSSYHNKEDNIYINQYGNDKFNKLDVEESKEQKDIQ